MYNPEKLTQYYGITYMRKESEKELICIADLLCYTPEINTALQVNYIPIIFFLNKAINTTKVHNK